MANFQILKCRKRGLFAKMNFSFKFLTIVKNLICIFLLIISINLYINYKLLLDRFRLLEIKANYCEENYVKLRLIKYEGISNFNYANNFNLNISLDQNFQLINRAMVEVIKSYNHYWNFMSQLIVSMSLTSSDNLQLTRNQFVIIKDMNKYV
jgi:hypothetical protein